MALIGANELKRKLVIDVEGQPFTVVEVTFSSPSARGASTMVRTKLRHLLTGAVQEKSFKASEKFAECDVELSPITFLYADAEGFHFMDDVSYDNFSFDAEQIGEDRYYLKDNLSLQALKYNGAPVSLQLPQFVELTVRETEPGIAGNSASGGVTKQATLETGAVVRVPLFIREGETVRVNTQTGEFDGRA
ncbi:MAG: elongation factor P [Blastocatellia bacterium]